MTDRADWPSWLLETGAETGAHLKTIDEQLVRATSLTKAGHSYQFSSNSQYNSITVQLTAVGDGTCAPCGIGSVAPFISYVRVV